MRNATRWSLLLEFNKTVFDLNHLTQDGKSNDPTHVFLDSLSLTEVRFFLLTGSFKKA